MGLSLAAILLITILGVGLASCLLRLTFLRSLSRTRLQFEQSIQAVEEIINQRRVPQAWVLPCLQPTGRLNLIAGNPLQHSPLDLDAMSLRAQQRCIQQLDATITFLQHRNYCDSPLTQSLLLTELRQRRADWQTLDWKEVLRDAVQP